MTRTYAWRTWKGLGGHLLEQTFTTPSAAGHWRAANFPSDEDEAPLTLVALLDGEQMSPTALELCDAHIAYMRLGMAA